MVAIRDPVWRGDALTCRATVRDGPLPARVAGRTLSIDPCGRPLTRDAAVGVRRRKRRQVTSDAS